MLKFNCFLPRLPMKLNGVAYGKNLKLVGWPFVFRFSNAAISIGNNVILNSNFWSNLLGVYQRTIIIAKNGGKIEIGNNVGISGSTIYARESIVIGDNTIIGVNCKIVDNDFHPTDAQTRLEDYCSNVAHQPIVIGKNVFVGMNSIILKGVTIGDNAVIGAGSVVHEDVPANCTVAGNPARIIKQN